MAISVIEVTYLAMELYVCVCACVGCLEMKPVTNQP